MTPEEKVALLKEAGVWDVIGYPTCIDKLFDLIAAHERNRLAWTQEHWTQYEHAIAAAEREACAKVVEQGTGEAVQKHTLEILLNERKRIAEAILNRGDV